jgi:hypothetical protein
MLPPEAIADFSQGAALRVGEPEFSREVGVENPVLRDQVFALEEQALIDQACHVRQQLCPFVIPHEESI